MTGYTYGESQPTENCPYCSTLCYADFADVGVGYTQVGPFHCTNCEASEIGAYDEPRELSAVELLCGWYAPGAQPGSSANMIDGKIVDHQTAKDAYANQFEGNPLYHVPGHVEEWWQRQRIKP
jgi:hypothetical protein